MNAQVKLTILLPIDMKTLSRRFCVTSLQRFLPGIVSSSLALGLAMSEPIAVNAADIAKTFATPEEAVSALVAAANSEDTTALRVIFGPLAADIENPDRVQAANEFSAFNAVAKQRQHIARESDLKCVLELGDSSWPFPVPIVKKDGRWFFDTEAGKDELLNRRIGKNELSTLQTARAYVDAQRDYATKDRDDDQVLEYAQKFKSTPGTKDGLYWPSDLDGEISPLGPLVAQAQEEGYARKPRDPNAEPNPFHGYFFKILTRQAKSAPGGKYDYVINGNMIGGFALVAWPSDYGASGIMTFIVNQQGQVYQKDLGPKTAKVAASMKAYDPDPTWKISPN